MMDGMKYKRLARTTIVPYMENFFMDTGVVHTFMQDNAPCHKAAIVLEEFDEGGVQLCHWPANSPNLNPIENLWAILKFKLTKHSPEERPKTMDELWICLQTAWDEVDLEHLKSLVYSMPKRMRLVIQAGGGSISY